MVSVRKIGSNLLRRLNAVADRPADPAALTGRYGSRRHGRPEDLTPGGTAAVQSGAEQAARARRSGESKPPRPKLEGQDAIDAILAEQRRRMRGSRGRDTGGSV